MTESHAGVQAIRAAAPTSRHAEFLFDVVTELLGEFAYTETAPGDVERRLFRRDRERPELVIPWPLVRLRYGSRTVIELDIPGVDFVQPPPPQRRVPKLRGLRPGTLEVQNGAERVEIAYGEDGGWFETCVSSGRSPLPSLAPTSATPPGNALEAIAERIATLGEPANAPGRVYVPAPVPMGAEGVWNSGLRSLRRALFRGRVRHPSARWAAVDAYEGDAIGHGSVREEALIHWWMRLEHMCPLPPKPVKDVPAPPSADGSIVLVSTGPHNDVPWPKPTIRSVPAALVELPPPPHGSPPLGSWVRLVGSHGRTWHAALMKDLEGFTLIGEHMLSVLDPSVIEVRLTTADRDHAQRMPAFERSPDLPPLDSRVTTYRLIEEGTGKAVPPSVEQVQERVGFDAGDFDGDSLVWRVLRQRTLR